MSALPRIECLPLVALGAVAFWSDPSTAQIMSDRTAIGTFFARFDADKRSDLLFQGLDNRFWLSLSTGSGFSGPQLALTHGGPFNPGGTHIADVNGDGKADIIFQGVDNRFWLSLSTGSGFADPQLALTHGDRLTRLEPTLRMSTAMARPISFSRAWTTSSGCRYQPDQDSQHRKAF